MNAEAFQQFYQGDLLPHLEQLEEQRKQTVQRLVRNGLIIGGIAAVVALALVARAGLFALIPVIVSAIIFFVLWGRITKGYVTDFKREIIGRVVKFVSPDLNYCASGRIQQAVYLNSKIFLTRPDRYAGEDLVHGKVGATEIQFSEVHSEYKTQTTDSKGNTRTQWHTIFKGIFFVADFNKHFQGETVVVPDVAERLFGRFGQKLQAMNLSRGQLVKLEDVEFEKLYAVYSSDQIEARYLLTPSLMARIVGFVNRTGHHVYLSFVDSNLYVAIPHSKDMFEPKLFKSILDTQLIQEYLDDLMLAVSLVEELNLNTRIWTKQ